jgi:hypothetical protein
MEPRDLPHRFSIRAFVALLAMNLFLLTGCLTGSIPNLEKPECTESREVVKRFYSFHFGNEMRFSRENLTQRERFLTSDFVTALQNLETGDDVFTTGSDDLPRAFRLGKCEVLAPDTTEVEILLFWRTDNETRQQSITAEVRKQNEKWLINKISR